MEGAMLVVEGLRPMEVSDDEMGDMSRYPLGEGLDF